MVKLIITAAQIVIASVLILLILLQAKGVGLSATFGGEGGFYRSKRGVEKLLFRFTILISFLFFLLSVIGLIAS